MTQEDSGGLDVLIVGAGPTGLVMAAELARRGIKCRLLDKMPAPSPYSRAIGVQARTLELFENMGIVDSFVALGHKSHGMRMVAENHEITHMTFDGLDTRYPYLLFLPQNDTERFLTGHLETQGIVIERNVELTGLVQHPDRVDALVKHFDGSEETISASWLIGCDGAHSTVRHLLNIPFTGTAVEDRFLLADVATEGLPTETEFFIYLHTDGLVALFPMGNGRFRLIADHPPGTESTAQKEPTLEECQVIMNARGPGNVILSALRWISNFRISYRLASELRLDRVFLAGDAANIHSPAGAQGMNTGIQDAFNLAWKLALVIQNLGSPSLLNSYHSERYPVEKSVTRQSELLLGMASLRPALARSLRDHLLPLLMQLHPIQDRMRRQISELAIHYPDSSIVEEHLFEGDVAAGDRAPDVNSLLTLHSTPTRLFQSLPYPRSALLLLSGRQPQADTFNSLRQIGKTVEARHGRQITSLLITATAAPPDAFTRDTTMLLDPTHALHTRYGGGVPCLYLIRPDGYVGFRAPLTASEHLMTYLASIYV